MITLYLNWNAVCAQKVVLALEEKAVPYEIKHVDLRKFEQHEPWYLALNPGGVVPTMVWHDHIILESTVMSEFIEDQFPKTPLRPVDPLMRAKMRYWGKLIDDIVHPSIRPLSFMTMVRPIARQIAREDLDAVMARTPKKEIADLWRRAARAPYTKVQLGEFLHKIEGVFDKMEASLQSSPFLAGADYTLADANATPYFRRLAQLGKTELWGEGTRPALTAWLSRIEARPSYASLGKLQADYS